MQQPKNTRFLNKIKVHIHVADKGEYEQKYGQFSLKAVEP